MTYSNDRQRTLNHSLVGDVVLGKVVVAVEEVEGVVVVVVVVVEES